MILTFKVNVPTQLSDSYAISLIFFTLIYLINVILAYLLDNMVLK